MPKDPRPDSPAEIVGARIRAIRQSRGLTLAELSARIGLTGRGNLSNLERGNVSPRLETLVKIAEGLEVPVALLVADLGPDGRSLRGLIEELDPQDAALAAILVHFLAIRG
jgi:transcriptional regulator with XRE-family HTH domain